VELLPLLVWDGLFGISSRIGTKPMLGAILEALVMVIYRIIKGEAQDASKPPKAEELGPPPLFVRDRWNSRVCEFIRGKEGSNSSGK
jgi:hypothetical protein